jgi:hypothetical protein
MLPKTIPMSVVVGRETHRQPLPSPFSLSVPSRARRGHICGVRLRATKHLGLSFSRFPAFASSAQLAQASWGEGERQFDDVSSALLAPAPHSRVRVFWSCPRVLVPVLHSARAILVAAGPRPHQDYVNHCRSAPRVGGPAKTWCISL